MPTPTYVALAKTILSVDTSTVTFSSIPQTYTDLILLVSARTTQSAVQTDIYVRISGDSSSANYSYTYLRGDGSTASSGRFGINNFNASAIGFAPGATATTNTFSNSELYIPNYTVSTYKQLSASTVAENNATAARIELDADLWLNTGAVTSLLLIPNFGSFTSGSRFDLYGIKNS